MARLLALLFAVLTLAACGSLPRETFTASDLAGEAPRGLNDIRFNASDAQASIRFAEAARTRRANQKTFDVLAISGGGSNGAYGAGVLVGWTKTGERPEFDIVTGVSTGALTAPFAFLGPDWDRRLTEAYTSKAAERILERRGLSLLFKPGFYDTKALRGLVEKYVDPPLLYAVAMEHAKGRRLLIATTNLDSQRAVVWDMGEIATRGGEKALKLFRTLLVASSSVPGVLPPKLIDVEVDGEPHQEMHVDGGVAAPLFLMPDALLHWRNLGSRFRRGRVHVIVNTVLDPSTQSTLPGVASIMSRSFDTMLRFSYRQALSLAAGFCSRHNLPLSVASIPNAFEGLNLLKFETDLMRRIYDAGHDQAVEGTVWTSAVEEQSLWRGLFKKQVPPHSTGTGVIIRDEPGPVGIEAPLEP